GSMGLAGIPPINGFVSKWFLIAGTLEGGMMIPVVIFVISGLLNVGYFFPIIHRAYFRKGDETIEGHGEASPFMVVPIMITALLSVVFGLFPDLFFNFYELAHSIAINLFSGG
ncbi:MAG: monovalent cation/H+ antiporter subunit D family protein, partial [Balneolaceae bacterium]